MEYHDATDLNASQLQKSDFLSTPDSRPSRNLPPIHDTHISVDETTNTLTSDFRVDTTSQRLREFPNFSAGIRHPSATLLCCGTTKALDNLSEALIAGFKQQHTNGFGLEGLLYALEISLAAVHRKDGKRTPNFDELKDCYMNKEYMRAWEKYTAHLDPEARLSFLVENNHWLDTSVLLLAVVGDKLGESYQLAHIDDQPGKSLHRPLNVYLHESLTRKRATKTVWVFTERRADGIAHWSGMASETNQDSFSLEAGRSLQYQEIPREGNSSDEHLEDEEAMKRGNFQIRSRYDSGPYLYRYQGVMGAPSAQSNLPYDLIPGITGTELMFFFPNHAVNWPACCARLVADGFSFKDMENIINSRDDTFGSQKLIVSSSIRHNIDRGESKFLGPGSWKRGSATRAMLQSTQWQHLNENVELKPAWTLRQIAQSLLDQEIDVQTEGHFSLMVKEEMETIRTGLPTTQRRMSQPHPASLNPPILPAGWQHGAEGRAYRRAETKLAVPATKSDKLVPGAARNVNWQKVLEATNRDPDTIIENYSHLIAGELLLWLLSKKGGCLRAVDIQRKLAANSRRSTGHKPLDQSTLTYRKTAALAERAKKHNRSLSAERKIWKSSCDGSVDSAHKQGRKVRREIQHAGIRKRMMVSSHTPAQLNAVNNGEIAARSNEQNLSDMPNDSLSFNLQLPENTSSPVQDQSCHNSPKYYGYARATSTFNTHNSSNLDYDWSNFLEQISAWDQESYKRSTANGDSSQISSSDFEKRNADPHWSERFGCVSEGIQDGFEVENPDTLEQPPDSAADCRTIPESQASRNRNKRKRANQTSASDQELVTPPAHKRRSKQLKQ